MLVAPTVALAEEVAGATDGTTLNTSAPVTWSVAPADADGADGRAWVELQIDPGATATDRLVVHNLGDQDVVFRLSAADGYFTATGRFNMLPSDERSLDAGTWITIDETVTVSAGGTVVVPFTVTVPEDATPGDHAAGVAASITSVSAGDGAKLGVESRVGFRVMTRVTGEIEPGLGVAADGDYRISWNPFAPGDLDVSAVLANTGNIRLAVDPAITSGGERIAIDGVTDGQSVELLPGDRRTVHFAVPAVWPLGAIGLPLRVEAVTVEPDGSSTAIEPVEHQITVLALPVPQLALLLAVALIGVGVGFGHRHQRRRVERMLADARAAGRREVFSERE
ncbi:WxL protein peptidoglycan domain-containing protein [Agromyces sp. NPDC058104]|uniref:WxL protein peptidoglycan domain-containing protein n=1 Tax=Agromyces sp. NPDC058104 TaxID=3346342 RepID=UPI0036D950DA